MNLPDIIGFAWDEVLVMLEEMGFRLNQVYTAFPPAKPKPVGIPRVVRVSWNDQQLDVVVAYQDYGKEV